MSCDILYEVTLIDSIYDLRIENQSIRRNGYGLMIVITIGVEHTSHSLNMLHEQIKCIGELQLRIELRCTDLF